MGGHGRTEQRIGKSSRGVDWLGVERPGKDRTAKLGRGRARHGVDGIGGAWSGWPRQGWASIQKIGDTSCVSLKITYTCDTCGEKTERENGLLQVHLQRNWAITRGHFCSAECATRGIEKMLVTVKRDWQTIDHAV